MASQSSGNGPNLGRFTIRTQNAALDLRVGAFWRQQKGQNVNEPNSNNGNVRGDLPIVKRLATAGITPNRPTSHNINGSVNSNSSTQESHPRTQTIDNSAPGSDRINALESRMRTKIATQVIESSQATSNNSGHTLMIDTQPSCSESHDTGDTHESFVVDLNPENLQSDENDSNQTSQRPSDTSPECILSGFVPNAQNLPKQMRKKLYPKQMPYDKILSHVTFVMSGYENPRRGILRDAALEMGARYQPSWNRFCTHLICAFKNTPKYKEVIAANGRIVREHWIQECSRKRQLLDWRDFKLGKYPYPDSEEEVDLDDLDYALETGYGVKPATGEQ